MSFKKEVVDFIQRRWRKDSNWLNGNCLWFASILCMRFEELEIYYLPHEGHFIAGKNGCYFDWRGVIEIDTEEPIIKLSWIKDNDPLWYDHLIRDCFN